MTSNLVAIDRFPTSALKLQKRGAWALRQHHTPKRKTEFMSYLGGAGMKKTHSKSKSKTF